MIVRNALSPSRNDLPSDLARASDPVHPDPLASPWHECRFLTCSVLPVRVACDLACAFCFSRSSLSALRHEPSVWRSLPVRDHFRWARSRGATRLVITGGGEPLLRADDALWLVDEGRAVFDEIALFTNGTHLTRDLARALASAGLSYLCWSRHHPDDEACRRLMGPGAPPLHQVLDAAQDLVVRATCVMARGFVDDTASAWRYIDALRPWGVRQFTFKHTYVAYPRSLFRDSPEDAWARAHQIDFDPFANEGAGESTVLSTLPWGPVVRRIRRIEELDVCHYREPTPEWELSQRLCRSSNLLSDGSVYASLEDRRSLLHRLAPS